MVQCVPSARSIPFGGRLYVIVISLLGGGAANDKALKLTLKRKAVAGNKYLARGIEPTFPRWMFSERNIALKGALQQVRATKAA